MMKLIEFKTRDDWGKDYYISFLKGRQYAALQVSFSICEYPSCPYVQVQMGMGKLFGFLACAWRIGFDIDLFGNTWRFND